MPDSPPEDVSDLAEYERKNYKQYLNTVMYDVALGRAGRVAIFPLDRRHKSQASL